MCAQVQRNPNHLLPTFLSAKLLGKLHTINYLIPRPPDLALFTLWWINPFISICHFDSDLFWQVTPLGRRKAEGFSELRLRNKKIIVRHKGQENYSFWSFCENEPENLLVMPAEKCKVNQIIRSHSLCISISPMITVCWHNSKPFYLALDWAIRDSISTSPWIPMIGVQS